MESSTMLNPEGDSQSSAPRDHLISSHTSHLISHCPEDVLRPIFEATAGPPSPYRGIWQAIYLSTVCRLWRVAALQTPKIWNTIYLPMGPRDWDWEECLRLTVWRAKNSPIMLRIRHLCSNRPNDLARAIQALPLIVENLQLEFDHLADMTKLANIWGEFPVDVMDLTVYVDPLTDGGRHTGGWYNNGLDLLLVSTSVHCRRSFSLVSAKKATTLRLSGIVYSQITRLSLNNVQVVDIAEVCRKFTVMEGLDLQTCTFVQVYGLVSIRQLLSLRIAHCVDITWLDRVQSPRLESASFSECSLGHVNGFLARHPKISNLSIHRVIDHSGLKKIVSMAGITDEVTCLTLDSECIRWLMAEGAFPSLRSLTIDEVPLLGATEFESVVKGRCLPPLHPKAATQCASRVLDDFFLQGVEFFYSWSPVINSGLYIEAIKEVQRSPENLWGTMKLTWPVHSGDSPSESVTPLDFVLV